MNWWALIAIAASTVAVVLLYACIAVAETNIRLRAINADLCKEGNELIAQFDAMERYNKYLEATAYYAGNVRSESEPTCTVCGSYMEWEDCWNCGGKGDWEDCDICEGKGGYWICASLPHEEATP